MKKLYFLALLLFVSLKTFSQTPEKMSFQAIIRDNSNALLTNQPIGIQISILQGSSTGSDVYVETHNVSTNINGLVTLEIGTGTVVSGSFSGIDWANGPYFIKTETDPTGGASYTIVGVSQLLSVPYALYALNSGSSIAGPQGPAGLNGVDGLDGATGPMGPQGPAGNDGLDGATGPMGPQGPAGNDGLDGATGPMGPQGPAGLNGADGINGLDGATGPMGPQGPAGNDGLDGATGPMGPQGPAGNDGLDGATGPMGPQGPAGLNGVDGLDGATGPMGPQGPAGLNGADGINGLDGATGPMGPQGPAGNDGLDGATGPMGPQGPAGNDGLDGATGPIGLTGSSAYQVAVANGFVGDEIAWLASLVGPMGPQGPAGLPAYTAKQPLVIAAVSGGPITKPTVVDVDFIRSRVISPAQKEIQVDFKFFAQSISGSVDKSGDYLFTLPDGYSFNLLEHPITTTGTYSNACSFSIREANIMLTQSGSTTEYKALIIPYSATQFRIGGDDFFVSDSHYGINDAGNKSYVGNFKFIAQ